MDGWIKEKSMNGWKQKYMDGSKKSWMEVWQEKFMNGWKMEGWLEQYRKNDTMIESMIQHYKE